MGLLRKWALWPFNQSNTSEGWPSSRPTHPYKVRNSHNQGTCTLRSLASLLDHTQVPGILEFPESRASSQITLLGEGVDLTPSLRGSPEQLWRGVDGRDVRLHACKGPPQYDVRPERGKDGGHTINYGWRTSVPKSPHFHIETQSNPSMIDSNFAFQVISESLFSNVELNHSILIVR